MSSVADAENSFIPLEGPVPPKNQNPVKLSCIFSGPSGKILVRQAWGSFRTNRQAGSDSDSSHSTKSREPSPVLHSPPSAVAHSSGEELDQKTDEQENQGAKAGQTQMDLELRPVYLNFENWHKSKNKFLASDEKSYNAEFSCPKPKKYY